jgi:hypothetical protein
VANAVAESDRLLMLSRLASASGCPPGLSMFTWLESLKLVELVGGRYEPTARSRLRSVGKDSPP